MAEQRAAPQTFGGALKRFKEINRELLQRRRAYMENINSRLGLLRIEPVATWTGCGAQEVRFVFRSGIRVVFRSGWNGRIEDNLAELCPDIRALEDERDALNKKFHLFV